MRPGVERDYAAPFEDAPGIVANKTTDTSRVAGKSPVAKGSARRGVFLWFAEHPGSCVSDLELTGLFAHGTLHARVNELLGKNGKFNEVFFGRVPLLRYSNKTKTTAYGRDAHVIELTDLGQTAYDWIRRNA